LFAGISGVRLLPDGGVVVADDRSSTIRLFGPNGTHLLTLGGPGEGPGEFEWLSHVSVEAPDTILVYDGRRLRITRFLTDGRLISTTALQPHDGSPELYLGEYSNGDAALAWIVPGPRDPNTVVADIMKVGRFRSDGAFAAELGTFQGMRRLGPGPCPSLPSHTRYWCVTRCCIRTGLRRACSS
jgi:hypothetical protein